MSKLHVISSRACSSDKRYDLGDVGRYRINKKLGSDTSLGRPRTDNGDIVSIVKYLIGLINSKAVVDDIDHLSQTVVYVRLASSFTLSSAWVLHVWRVPSRSV
jgi:DNA-directed RNA polymerase beta subunit